MPRYAILQSHPPDNCPMTNRAVREFAMEHLPKIDEYASNHGVRVLAFDHLDPAHRALLLLEAPTAEAARDFVFDAGFVHFTEMEFFLVTPVAELLQRAADMATIF
jgi:hypothetical protein